MERSFIQATGCSLTTKAPAIFAAARQNWSCSSRAIAAAIILPGNRSTS